MEKHNYSLSGPGMSGQTKREDDAEVRIASPLQEYVHLIVHQVSYFLQNGRLTIRVGWRFLQAGM
jgi:hypothetical protein